MPLLLALDRGEAMKGRAIAAALGGICELIGRLGPEDRAGLIAFNGKVLRPVPIAPVRDGRYLNEVLTQLEARNGSDLSAALEEGIADCLADGDAGDLVLVTAGRPTAGRRRADQLERIAMAGRDRGVRISTIAVGGQPDRDLLVGIAVAGGGRSAFAPDAATVADELDRLSRRPSGDH